MSSTAFWTSRCKLWGLGVAFAKDDTRGLDTQLNATLAEMRADGTTAQILAKYLPDPDKYLEVDSYGN